MVDAMNAQGGQTPTLPSITGAGAPASAPQPTALTTVQSAQAILMNISLSPHDMAEQFGELKEQHLKQTYGIAIE